MKRLVVKIKTNLLLKKYLQKSSAIQNYKIYKARVLLKLPRQGGLGFDDCLWLLVSMK
jgi:hypothetical protein